MTQDQDYWAPTLFNQMREARKLLREKGYQELARHAHVLIDNRSPITDCFCSACFYVMQEYAKASPATRKRMLGK